MESGKSVSFEIRTLSNMMKRSFENTVAKKCDKNFTGLHGQILKYIFCNYEREIFQRDIENEFSIRRSTVSTILKLMEKNGLISRVPVYYDARLKKIEPTELASTLYAEIKQDIEKMNAKIEKNLTHQELEAFFTLSEKIKNNLSE